MTQNQIALYKAKVEAEHYRQMDAETAKHNRAVEGEATRHAMISESIESEKNRISEAYNTGTLAHYVRTDTEAARSNREQERIKQATNIENIRHDVMSEANEAERNRISKLSAENQLASIRETVRHDLATEQLTRDKQAAEVAKLRAESASISSNMRLDDIRFEQIKSQSLLNLENVKNAGFDRLLTEQKIYSESALTDLRKEQTGKTTMETNLMGVNTWANAMKGLGGLLSGLKSVPVLSNYSTTGGYDSSATYNAYTGLYE